MPKESSEILQTPVKSDFFTLRNLPPVVKRKGPKTVPVYGWSVENNVLIIVKTGERDPHQDVQAAKGPTLQDIIKRQPGKTHMDKLANAVNSGVLATGMKPHTNPADQQTFDMTGVPDNFLDAQNVLAKGRKAADSLPDDFTNGSKLFDKILDLMTPEQIQSYINAKFPKKEAPSNE